MQLIDELQQQIDVLERQHLTRRLQAASTPCQPHTIIRGEPRVAFCSNDYLGLANHPAVVQAFAEGVQRWGAGSGGSHLISGHYEAHEALEDALTAHLAPQFDVCRSLYFSTGYMANLAVVPALAAAGIASHGPGSVAVFAEALNHASLIDGVRLARGASVHVYPHNDHAALDAMLSASKAACRIIVTDGVYSMDGDIAPLPELVALAERHQAWLVVDDAHGYGVLGEHGRGVLEHCQVRSPHLILVGTLGKAAGVSGAFVTAHPTVISWLIQKARSFIFTTASPPAVAHALCTSIALIAGEEGNALRQRLRGHIASLQDSLKDYPLGQLLPSFTAIQPLVIGENAAALAMTQRLLQHGLWVPAIRPPTVAPGTARLRIALSAAHDEADVDTLCQALWQLANATDT
ncbi:8-amino-7-oxononanoate synthase [Brachymonas denitrificans]|uniref:aminotransferase class I/II-fold pyridoxal phosphate-dependent enzyme n=1 Tax=Brachymonas denitrificans TaxID=28220 RepID=UPI002AFEB186|nr:8-amino-7-oxononanoate synthase [Brachymonas denitrificans]